MRADKWILLFFVVLLGTSILGTYTHEINVGLYTVHTTIVDTLTPDFEIQDYESWNVTTIDSNAYSSMNGIVFLLPIAIVGVGVLAIVIGAFAFR